MLEQIRSWGLQLSSQPASLPCDRGTGVKRTMVFAISWTPDYVIY
jgi:hypothetical protein